MTREEAGQICKEVRHSLWILDEQKPIWDKGTVSEALDMAIEALNREQKKYDAICSELVALKSNLNEPIEVAMAYEKSIAIVRKYARREDE